MTKTFYVLRHAPWAVVLYLIQCLCTVYCLVLAGRMTLAVVANLTVNEMENSHRYTHFHSDDGTKVPQQVRPRVAQQLPRVLARASGTDRLGRHEDRGGQGRVPRAAARVLLVVPKLPRAQVAEAHVPDRQAARR